VAPYVHPKLGRSLKSEDVLVIDDPFGFVIDPAVARALRDDVLNLFHLRGTRHLRPDDRERQEVIARIKEMESTLECPPGYTKLEYEKDGLRLGELAGRREASGRRNKLTEEEDAEEAHLKARRTAYRQTPEERQKEEDRKRIFCLMLRCSSRNSTPEEHAEFARLKARYPDPPPSAPKPRHETGPSRGY